jgi:uncharacterized protein YjiS (DUF1127 family)
MIRALAWPPGSFCWPTDGGRIRPLCRLNDRCDRIKTYPREALHMRRPCWAANHDEHLSTRRRAIMQPHSKSNHPAIFAHFVPPDLRRRANFLASTFHARTIAAASVLREWGRRWRSRRELRSLSKREIADFCPKLTHALREADAFRDHACCDSRIAPGVIASQATGPCRPPAAGAAGHGFRLGP